MRRKLVTAGIIAAVLLMGAFILSRSSLTLPLSDKAAAKYDKYLLTVQEGENADDLIRAHTAYIETTTADEYTFDIYASVSLDTLLPDCAQITEISHSSYGAWNISYSTIDQKEVRLTYLADGSTQLVVYDEKTDRCVEITPDHVRMYTNFRGAKG